MSEPQSPSPYSHPTGTGRLLLRGLLFGGIIFGVIVLLVWYANK